MDSKNKEGARTW
uniref:Uncharacterized protein n=1 Tax=Arundo donax TaxID=35708 RepID=A0A0A9EQG2_ARUDO